MSHESQKPSSHSFTRNAAQKEHPCCCHFVAQLTLSTTNNKHTPHRIAHPISSQPNSQRLRIRPLYRTFVHGPPPHSLFGLQMMVHPVLPGGSIAAAAGMPLNLVSNDHIVTESSSQPASQPVDARMKSRRRRLLVR